MNAIRIILVIFVIAAVIGCQRQSTDDEVADTSEEFSDNAPFNQNLLGPGGI